MVLLDLIMPKMDGLTVMDQINQDKSVSKRPYFIVITAVGQEKITEDAFNKGANYYMMKPFQNENFHSHFEMPLALPDRLPLKRTGLPAEQDGQHPRVVQRGTLSGEQVGRIGRDVFPTEARADRSVTLFAR